MNGRASRPTSWRRQGHRRRLPARRVLATEEAAKGMTPGTHGSTFGGNPLAMAVGNAVLDIVLEPRLPRRRPAEGSAPETGARGREGRASRSRRRSARPGPAAGIKVKVPPAEVVEGALGREAARRRRQRQRRAAAAAAQHRRRRDRRGDRASVARARARCGGRNLKSLFSSAGRSAMAQNPVPSRSRGISSISTRSTPRRCAPFSTWRMP